MKYMIFYIISILTCLIGCIFLLFNYWTGIIFIIISIFAAIYGSMSEDEKKKDNSIAKDWVTPKF